MEIDHEKEKKQILNAYRGLLRSMSYKRTREETKLIRKAFDVAVEAHKDMRRKSGEPYIFHPIAVARICGEEMSLGPTSISCALLHDTVEDTDITLDDIEAMFGVKIRRIIDGLTKLSGVFDLTKSAQAENFRKMLLTIPEDLRVILVKLADRLHNMRTLESMRRDKQLKIASETSFLYAPLAHRLGLYAIKTELEDLSLKYTHPEEYQEIESKLKKTKEVRERFIRSFVRPISRELEKTGLKYNIKGRPKSIHSIWNKIHTKNVSFEEIFDVFAIRIIIESEEEQEKADCWKVYSVVTDFYRPNPERLRDWISHPKQNGYESLHTTVMSPTGKWVEVQIRTSRMDEIAEKGLAAHWKYKDGNDASANVLEEWISQIRDLLENKDKDALELIDDFQLNLFAKEIFVFTPKGDLFTLPANATALDFAFSIHSEVGAKCIGAKVNYKLVPLSHRLKSGDQVEILTSQKQKPKEDWLNYVITSKARTRIKSALKEETKKISEHGKEILQRKLTSLKVEFTEDNLKELLKLYELKEHTDLYVEIANGKIDFKKIKPIIQKGGKLKYGSISKTIKNSFESLIGKVTGKKEEIIIGDAATKFDYKLAPCCNPIPGDDVFGFLTINEGIKIHRTNCPNAKQLLANYAYRVIKARWQNQPSNEFLTEIRIKGFDTKGLVNDVTKIISEQEDINMKALSFDTEDGIFEGKITLFVNDKTQLGNLLKNLKNVDGINRVKRLENV